MVKFDQEKIYRYCVVQKGHTAFFCTLGIDMIPLQCCYGKIQPVLFPSAQLHTAETQKREGEQESGCLLLSSA